MPIKYAEHAWCLRKHLTTLHRQLGEVLDKLARECTVGTAGALCKVSLATKSEANSALEEFLAAEKHLEDIYRETKDEFYLKLLDRVRTLRQRFVTTGLPFLVEEELSADVPRVVAEIREEVFNIIKELDKRAYEVYELEQCPSEVCREDLGKVLTQAEKVLAGKLTLVEDVYKGFKIYATDRELIEKVKQAIDIISERNPRLLHNVQRFNTSIVIIDELPHPAYTMSNLGTGVAAVHLDARLVKNEDPECIAFVLCHEFTHVIGIVSEDLCNYEAWKCGSCPPGTIEKYLVNTTRVYRLTEARERRGGRSMPKRSWTEVAMIALGGFTGRVISDIIAPYVHTAVKKTGVEPHERLDFYINVLGGIGLLIGGAFVEGGIGLYMMVTGATMLSKVANYVMEYRFFGGGGTKTSTMSPEEIPLQYTPPTGTEVGGSSSETRAATETEAKARGEEKTELRLIPTTY